METRYAALPGRRRRRGARVAVLLGGVAALLALPADVASAHAIVQRTEPAIDRVVESAPTHVAMYFNEPVELAFGAIRVFDTTGRRVDVAQAEHLPGDPTAVRVGLTPGLADGTYTVTWRVVSADGHPIEEAFVFHVGRPGENPLGIADTVLAGQAGAGRVEGALYGAARWLSFASLLVLVGVAAFLALVWVPGSSGLDIGEEVRSRFHRRCGRLLAAGWVGAVVGTLLSYLLQASVAADLPVAQALSADLLGRLAGTRFGIVTLSRLGLLVVLALAWLAIRGRLEPGAGRSVEARVGTPAVPPWAVPTGGLLALALLATPGLAGHAGSTSPIVPNLVADAAHLAAASLWVGGLVTLLVAAYPAVRATAPHERVRFLAPQVARFSNVAVVAIGVLVVTGLFRSWVEVRALRALTGTSYGAVLLVKLGAFLPMLALGAVNNRWTKPRLERAATSGEDGGAATTLGRIVRVEVVLGAVVIAVTALLVNLPPGRVSAGLEGPLIVDVRLGSNNLNVLVDPNRIGENEVHLNVTEPSGAPAGVEAMRVLFRMPSERIGPLVGRGTELGPGHFVVQGRQLSVAGEWVLEVVARTGRFDEERARVRVLVNA